MKGVTKSDLCSIRPPPTREIDTDTWRAALRVSRLGGPTLAAAHLDDGFKSEARAEVWLSDCLRRGRTELTPDDLTCRIVPTFLPGHAPRCLKISVEVTLPDGVIVPKDRSWGSFATQAIQIASTLRSQGKLGAEEDFCYELVAFSATAPDAGGPGSEVLRGTVTRAPLHFRRSGILPALLARARVIGELDPSFHPIVMTEEAHARAEALARAGASHVPPVETVAILTSALWSCKHTGEFFLLIRDALEVAGAEHGEFQVRFTEAAWSWLESVRRRLLSREETADHRVVGQAHGHNFLPVGGPCEDCPKRALCGRHTAFASTADCNWTRAVFLPYQPWGVSLIHGLNARSEPVEIMYSLRDGQLVPRGFHVIPESVLAELEQTQEEPSA
jgi:hypothetical protein